MIWLTSLFLLLTSAALLWWNRPAANWPGAAAARFAGALITALYALLAPLPYSALATTQLLLEQLSLYAALPLLLSVTLATSLGFDWSRMIWGRVLLVWCVVFELCRRNNVLPEFLQLLLLAGTLILFWPLLNAARQRTGGLSRLTATAAFGWLLLCVIGLLLPAWLPVPLLLAIATLLIFITSHRRQNLPG